ncbi:MAG TPA: hypothetical protein VGC26_11705 [Afipia sp.]
MYDDNKSDRAWRNRRLIDIATVIGLLAVLMLGYRLLAPHLDSPTQTSYIVPSQHVHW